MKGYLIIREVRLRLLFNYTFVHLSESIKEIVDF